MPPWGGTSERASFFRVFFPRARLHSNIPLALVTCCTISESIDITFYSIWNALSLICRAPGFALQTKPEKGGLEPCICLKHHPLADDEGSCKAAINVRCRNRLSRKAKSDVNGASFESFRKSFESSRNLTFEQRPRQTRHRRLIYSNLLSLQFVISLEHVSYSSWRQKKFVITLLPTETSCDSISFYENFDLIFVKWVFQAPYDELDGFSPTSQMSFHVFPLIVMLSSKKSHDMAAGRKLFPSIILLSIHKSKRNH